MAQIPPGQVDQDSRPPGSAAARARATRMQAFVGRPLDEATLRELRALAPGRLRVLRRGDMRTMDFLEDRLNVEVDEHDVIRSLGFG